MPLPFCYSSSRRRGKKKRVGVSTSLKLCICSCPSTAEEGFPWAPERLEPPLFRFQATCSRKASEFALERNRR